MKKLMLALVSVSMVGSVAAWDMQVQNFTPQTLELKIHYGGAKGICSIDTKIMKPWTTRTYGTGLCCASHLETRPASGPRAGKWQTFSGLKYTGIGISCATNRIFIQELPDNTLGIERVSKKLPIK